MKKMFAAVLLASAVASPAIAANQGFYATAEAGKISFKGSTAPYLSNPGAITLGGGYHFNRNLSVEAGYSIAADSVVDTVTVGVSTEKETMKTKVLQVAAVGTFPINDTFELFGKLGLSNEKFDYTYSYSAPGNSYSTNNSASKTNLMYGIGGQFNINQHFGIRVQYQNFGKATFDNNCTGNCDFGAALTSVGMIYNY